MNPNIPDYKLRVAQHNLEIHLLDCVANSKDDSVQAWADDILVCEEVEEAIFEAMKRKGFKIEYPEDAGRFPEPLK